MTHKEGAPHFVHAGNLVVNVAHIVAVDFPYDDGPDRITVHMASGAPLVIEDEHAAELLDALGAGAAKKRKKKSE